MRRQNGSESSSGASEKRFHRLRADPESVGGLPSAKSLEVDQDKGRPLAVGQISHGPPDRVSDRKIVVQRRLVAVLELLDIVGHRRDPRANAATVETEIGRDPEQPRPESWPFRLPIRRLSKQSDEGFLGDVLRFGAVAQDAPCACENGPEVTVRERRHRPVAAVREAKDESIVRVFRGRLRMGVRHATGRVYFRRKPGRQRGCGRHCGNSSADTAPSPLAS